MTKNYDFVQKSSSFLPEIMTIVPSANIMVSDMVFIVGERPFMYVIKTRPLEVTLGAFHHFFEQTP
jgi:hypothetical protein